MSTRGRSGGKPRRVISLADQIRTAAADSGLSVYRIAKETGVDQSTLNKFLTGARDNLRQDVADRLFRFFFGPPRRKRRNRVAGRDETGPAYISPPRKTTGAAYADIADI